MSVNVSRGQARDSPARWDRIEASDLSVSVSNNIVCTGRLATWMRQRKGLCDQEGVGCKKATMGVLSCSPDDNFYY